jgi:hypothetical protein
MLLNIAPPQAKGATPDAATPAALRQAILNEQVQKATNDGESHTESLKAYWVGRFVSSRCSAF